MSTFANMEDPDEMQHNVRLHCQGKKIFRKKKTIRIFLKIIAGHPYIHVCTIDYPMFIYQTRRKNPLVYKGLIRFYGRNEISRQS